jgi:hypothetical protein
MSVECCTTLWRFDDASVIEDMVRSLSVTSFDGKSLPLEETFAGRRSSTFGVPTLEGRVVDHCKHHQPEDIFNVFYPLSMCF